MERVFFRAVSAYDDPTLVMIVDQLLANCGIDDLVGPGKRVLLKVNLLMRSAPQKAVTTHPAVVSAVIAALQARGVTDIVIADSPAGPGSALLLRDIYSACGLTALAGGGVTLNTDLLARPVSQKPGYLSGVEVLSAVLDADVVINLCKLKTHAMMGMTGAVKNCFGTVLGIQKSQMHFRFSDPADFGAMLCELCAAIAPAISLADAVTGMEGDGPSGGTPRDFGFIAAGRDAFVLDRALCHALGFSPAIARTVAASIQMGLAPKDAGALDIDGDRQFFDAPINDLVLPASLRHQFENKLPGGIGGVARGVMRRVAPYPVVRTRDCIGCGQCAQVCPKHIITIRDKKAVIDQSLCIRCFCCHEVCPARAIDIKRLFVRRKGA